MVVPNLKFYSVDLPWRKNDCSKFCKKFQKIHENTWNLSNFRRAFHQLWTEFTLIATTTSRNPTWYDDDWNQRYKRILRKIFHFFSPERGWTSSSLIINYTAHLQTSLQTLESMLNMNKQQKNPTKAYGSFNLRLVMQWNLLEHKKGNPKCLG